MDSSQDHGAALHGSSSCQVRCCTVQRPQCALLSAADHPRRTGVERSTSSTSSFIASTGTAAACRRPPAQLRRRADATADHMGPVAVQADLVVPPVSFVGPCVCGYRAFFFHFLDEYYLNEITHPPLSPRTDPNTPASEDRRQRAPCSCSSVHLTVDVQSPVKLRWRQMRVTPPCRTAPRSACCRASP